MCLHIAIQKNIACMPRNGNNNKVVLDSIQNQNLYAKRFVGQFRFQFQSQLRFQDSEFVSNFLKFYNLDSKGPITYQHQFYLNHVSFHVQYFCFCQSELNILRKFDVSIKKEKRSVQPYFSSVCAHNFSTTTKKVLDKLMVLISLEIVADVTGYITVTEVFPLTLSYLWSTALSNVQGIVSSSKQSI